MGSRKRMLVVLGVAVIANGACAVMFLFLLGAGIAESGSTARRGQTYGLEILSFLWPFLEAVLTWMWIVLSGARYSNSEYRRLGDGIVVATLILTPILLYSVARFSGIKDDLVLDAIMIGIPFVGHWTARILWIKQKEMTITSSV